MTLSISAADNIGTGALTLDSGSTLDLTAGLSLVDDIILNGPASPPASLIVSNGASDFINGQISGAGALSVSGGGTLYLTNSSNNYTGGTTVDGGAIVVNSGGGVLGAGTLALEGGADAYWFDDGISHSDWTVKNAITIAGASYFVVGLGDDVTLSGVISDGSAPGTLIATGDGSATITLTGKNSYTGGTTIANGEVSINNASALGTGGVTFTNTVGSALELAFTGTLANAITVADDAVATIGATAGHYATLTGEFVEYNSGVATLHFGSSVDTGVVNLASASLGDSALAGTTYVDGGTLRLGSADGAYVLTAINLTVGTLASTTATLDLDGNSLQGNDLTGNANGRITDSRTGAVKLTAYEDANSTFAGTISNGSGVIKLEVYDDNTLTLTGVNGYTGGTTIDSEFHLADRRRRHGVDRRRDHRQWRARLRPFERLHIFRRDLRLRFGGAGRGLHTAPGGRQQLFRGHNDRGRRSVDQ